MQSDFVIYCRCKVKKDNKLITLLQNNAVLRRAALSERRRRRTELARGCLVFRVCCRKKWRRNSTIFMKINRGKKDFQKLKELYKGSHFRSLKWWTYTSLF